MASTVPKHPAQRVRRNIPDKPDQRLPASGRKGRPPKCPLTLGEAGAAWWRWAWSTPQATQFNSGNLYALARRAQMEDRAAALNSPDLPTEMRALAGAELNKIDTAALKIEQEFGLTLKSAMTMHLWVDQPEEGTKTKADDGDNVLDMRNRAKALMTGGT